jgi:hypothetical protein
MPRPHKPDPYKDFKDDRERRLALNFRVTWSSIVTIVVACVLSNQAPSLAAALKWFKTLLQ